MNTTPASYIIAGLASTVLLAGCASTPKNATSVTVPETAKSTGDIWVYSTSSHFLAADRLGDNPAKSIAEFYAAAAQSPEAKKMEQDGWQPSLIVNNYALVGGADTPAGYYFAHRRLAMPPN
jgi:hypothetical protein